MKMPDVSGLGSYTECGQAIVVRHGEERGEYLHAMYVDSHPAIASGREVSAYPKKLGAPKLLVDSDTLVGTLDYGSLRVAVATMGYKHQPLDAEAARQEIGVPTFMIKMLPGYDRRWRICELVRMQIADITITGSSSSTCSRRWLTCRCARSSRPATSWPISRWRPPGWCMTTSQGPDERC